MGTIWFNLVLRQSILQVCAIYKSNGDIHIAWPGDMVTVQLQCSDCPGAVRDPLQPLDGAKSCTLTGEKGWSDVIKNANILWINGQDSAHNMIY